MKVIKIIIAVGEEGQEVEKVLEVKDGMLMLVCNDPEDGEDKMLTQTTKNPELNKAFARKFLEPVLTKVFGE